MVQFGESWGSSGLSHFVFLLLLIHHLSLVLVLLLHHTEYKLSAIPIMPREIFVGSNMFLLSCFFSSLIPPFFQDSCRIFDLYQTFRCLSSISVSIPTVFMVTFEISNVLLTASSIDTSQQVFLFQKRKIIHFLSFHLVEDRMKQKPTAPEIPVRESIALVVMKSGF